MQRNRFVPDAQPLRTSSIFLFNNGGSYGRKPQPASIRAPNAPTACPTSSSMIVGHRLNTGDHPNGLPGHYRPGLDVAVDHRAPQRSGPEPLDQQLRLVLRHLARQKLVPRLRLMLA